jgi:hypothetical protein
MPDAPIMVPEALQEPNFSGKFGGVTRAKSRFCPQLVEPHGSNRILALSC